MMRRLFSIGVVLLVIGTVADLVFHAITEPEEAFSLEMPRIELADHIVIAAGVIVVALTSIYLVGRAAWKGRGL